MGKTLENIANGFRMGTMAFALATGTISGVSAENNTPQAVELSVSNAPQITELSSIYAPFVEYDGEQILVPRVIDIKPNMKEIERWVKNNRKGEFHLTARFMSDNYQEVSPTYLIGGRKNGSKFYSSTLVGTGYSAQGSKPFIPEHPKVLFSNLNFGDLLGSFNPIRFLTGRGNWINVQKLMNELHVELDYSYRGHNVFIHAIPDEGNREENGYYKSKADYFRIDGGKKIEFPSN